MAALIERRSLRREAPLFGAASKHPLRVRLYIGMLATDVACVALAFIAAGFLRFGNLNGFGWVGVTGSILMLFTLCAVLTGAYSMQALRSSTVGIARALTSLMLSFALLLLITYFLRSDARFSRIITGTSFVGASIALALSRQIFNDWVERRFKGVLTNELVLCDGVDFQGSRDLKVQRTADIGLEPDPRNASMLFLLAGVVQGAERVIIACAPETAPKWALMLKGTDIRGEILSMEIDALGPTGVSSVNGRSTLIVSSGPLNVRQRITKRLFDLALTVPTLLVLLPLLGIVALVIKLDSPGPAIFRQRRVGRGNILFNIFKFRTMHTALEDSGGAKSASRDDSRTTRVGRFLRRTSIDELPQLVNVLLGSMSIVGPRPHALKSLAGDELFWHIDESYWHRHALKPGITGLAQVRGFRGATDTSEDLRSRLRSDLEYISGWSLWRDLSIVARTARVMVHSNAF